jgi:hypothetical protein
MKSCQRFVTTVADWCMDDKAVRNDKLGGATLNPWRSSGEHGCRRMTHGAKASRSRGTQTALRVLEILQERKAAGLPEALENLRMTHGLQVMTQ